MECIAEGFALCEAPVYDPTSRSVLVSDAVAGGMFLVRADGSVEPVVAHRRGIGGAALHVDGGLVVSGRNVAHRRDNAAVLLDQTGHEGFTHFNDLTTDRRGRVYVGLVDMPIERTDRPRRPGIVFRIDVDGSATVVADGIAGPNGMAFSPDARSFLLSDTYAGVVWHYDVGAEGTLTNRRVWAELPEEGPDGLAMAADGSAWIGLHYTSAVAHFDAEGRELTRLTTPAPATSVCFGDEDLRTLFVTTGTVRPGKRHGSVLRLRVETPGHPVAPARVRIPCLESEVR